MSSSLQSHSQNFVSKIPIINLNAVVISNKIHIFSSVLGDLFLLNDIELLLFVFVKYCKAFI